MGEGWLIGQINLPNVQDPIPTDRCLLLVLESSRVEVAVLLNELAYSKYEASKSSSLTTETIISKQQKVTIVFSLVENIIKLISNIGETEGNYFERKWQCWRCREDVYTICEMDVYIFENIKGWNMQLLS